MKVPRSVQRLYDAQFERCERLRAKVDDLFISKKEAGWFYRSRLKKADGFVQKLETGRFSNPSALEDFFACTLVVENSTSIGQAIDLVENYCTVEERRPGRGTHTYKAPEAFPFDTLRLYVRLDRDPALPEDEIFNIVFEVQIKTFLQHAWEIATHDLIYKADEVNWARARVAFQIKAMLEHAEVSIQQVEAIARTPDLNKENKQTKKIREIIELLREEWRDQNEVLPQDLRRLAENCYRLMTHLNLGRDVVRNVLRRESEEGRGIHTLNLSPYGILIQSLLNQRRPELDNFLTGEPTEFKILLPDEIEIPGRLDKAQIKNAVFV